MNKVTITAAAMLVGVLVFAGGAAVGRAIAPAGEVTAITAAQPVPCNLRLVWDRSEQSYQAVYEESALIGYAPTYGRVANLSCTDADILDWQDQRANDGLDAAVCRPVLQDDVVGTVRPIGCAAPTMVVTGEPR